MKKYLLKFTKWKGGKLKMAESFKLAVQSGRYWEDDWMEEDESVSLGQSQSEQSEKQENSQRDDSKVEIIPRKKPLSRTYTTEEGMISGDPEYYEELRKEGTRFPSVASQKVGEEEASAANNLTFRGDPLIKALEEALIDVSSRISNTSIPYSEKPRLLKGIQRVAVLYAAVRTNYREDESEHASRIVKSLVR